MPSFEIPDAPTTVALKDQMVKGTATRAGTATFSVTNKTAQRLTGRLSVQPQGDAKSTWFELMGEAERNFAGSETQKITVNLKMPVDAAVGDYKFRLRVVNVNDPDNDYTDSAVSTFSVARVKSTEVKPFPWWIVFVGVGVLLLIVGGGVAFVLTSGGIEVPDVSTQALSYEAAAQKISDAGLTPAKSPTLATTGTPGTVVSQDPTAGTKVDTGSTVTLTVVQPMVAVPDISSQRNKSFEAAYNELRSKGLTIGNQSCAVDPAHVDMVVGQDPAAGTRVAPGTEIAVSMGAQLCHIFIPWRINRGVITRPGF